MADSAPRLTLLSRGYCHLCDDMRATVESIRRDFGFELEVFDVDADAELERRYGDDVPVLLHQGREIARHRLEPGVLLRYLAQVGGET